MALKWEKDVYSSNVQSIAYDEDMNAMIVSWLKGKRSAYFGVPEDLAWEAANAPSVGSFLNSRIKNQYRHQYV